MCMKCGCSTPNDHKTGAQDFGGKTTSQTIIVKPTDASSGGYDGKGAY